MAGVKGWELFGQDQFPGFGLSQLIALALMDDDRHAIGIEQLRTVVARRRGQATFSGVSSLGRRVVVVIIHRHVFIKQTVK